VQFAGADLAVIAAPYWDLSFPASLKTYIERVNCVGVTFAYDEENRSYGMCRAKKLVYITTAGGTIIDETLGYGYLKALCENFYGIPETVCFKAENLDMPFTDTEEKLKKTEAEMDSYLQTCGN
jgi:FMN-dependent NADH-azoreductase